ncbi:hypothetical protein B0H12DRAFT_1017217 [Mycena haematopus]|nr:hypothetical protein B0H12DRAFT_1017217 [Mycena haematopus]
MQQLPLAATVPQGSLSTYNPAGPSSAPGPSASSAPWYQPGSHRCTYKDCTFRGSPQTVETHMMDRHLIFPPGWEKRKKRPEWDADPSLKGKPIPIQGTTVVLDSPEQLEAWVAERKRRWPSAPRVEEKKRKMAEAVARGQLPLEDSRLAGRKRRRMDEGNANPDRGRGRGREAAHSARGQGRAVDSGWRGRGRGVVLQQRQRPSLPASESSSSSDNSDDDGAPEEIESIKIEPVAAPPVAEVSKRPRPPQPKQPVRNPFASRPTLLRNLLLPEIRMTVSNLSQAIRFLVDNDFLQNVELKPGQANEKHIEILPEDRN